MGFKRKDDIKKTTYLDTQNYAAIEYIAIKKQWSFSHALNAWLAGEITESEIQEAKSNAKK